MSFLQKLIGRFQRKTEGYKAQQEDELALFTSKDLDIHHKEQREKYVRTHLEQMAESAKELEVLGYEYNLVTAYLTDMEEIESLPPEIRKELAEKGKRIAYLEDTQSQLMNKKNRMLEADYLQMDKWQEEMPSAIDKIKDSEEYQVLVKQDLHKLENEKQAYHFRKEELRVKIANAKGVALIAAIAGALCMIILLTLQMLLTMDVKIGYFLIVLLVAVTLTISYMMYTPYTSYSLSLIHI